MCDRLDDACAESWCEGTVDFEFTGLHCPKGGDTCTLTFKYKPYTSRQEEWDEGTCELNGIKTRSDLSDEDGPTKKVVRQIEPCVEAIIDQHP